ncbi:MAG: ribosomal protein S18-alanine N-acetyltransferase [Bulleidia sp.]
MIRRASIQDLQILLDLENRIFPEDPWSEKNFAYELCENPFASLYVYEQDSEVIGYLDLWITFEQAQIANIGVLPAYRARGIASALMEHAVACAQQGQCENMSLEVRRSNQAAIALYEKYGFLQVGIRRHYYEDGEDAFLMVKPMEVRIYDNDFGN